LIITSPISNPTGRIDSQTREALRGQVREAQQQLCDLGYALGGHGVDGVGGPDTTAALKAFQRDNGLPDTGFLDIHTQQQLSIQCQLNQGPQPDGITPLPDKDIQMDAVRNEVLLA